MALVESIEAVLLLFLNNLASVGGARVRVVAALTLPVSLSVTPTPLGSGRPTRLWAESFFAQPTPDQGAGRPRNAPSRAARPVRQCHHW